MHFHCMRFWSSDMVATPADWEGNVLWHLLMVLLEVVFDWGLGKIMWQSDLKLTSLSFKIVGK